MPDLSPQNLFTRYAANVRALTCPKKTVLLHQGNIADKLYLIEDGVLRLWHNHDGEDISLQFFHAGQVVGSFESLYLQTPSLLSLETLSKCRLKVIDRNDFLQILAKDPDVQKLLTHYVCHRMIDYTHLLLSRIQYSPEERYAALLEDMPQLFEEVPQHYIASYLGITPVSLSRIRNRHKAQHLNNC